MDARHHPFDVLTGCVMGILVAWISYRQYFPPVSETWRKGRAYPIRSWGRQPEPPRNPNILVDEDVEPLRPMRRPIDEESGLGATSGFSSQTEVAPGSGPSGNNVFREQISHSQRRRQEEGVPPFAVHHSDTMNSSLSTKVARYQGQMPGPNPYAADPRRHDTYEYSSSDEDESTYEMQQPRYQLSDNQARGPVYNPVSGTLTDTGYHPPPGISPNPTPPPPANLGGPPRPFPPTGGDLGDPREQGPAVPPHAPGTAS